MKPNADEIELFRITEQQYGTAYADHVLEQYKLYVTSADEISGRRQKTNEFFLSLNTALVGLLGFISTKVERREFLIIVSLMALAGITLCYLWHSIIRSYKGLNSGKFAIIHAIESRLPLSLYHAEWRVLKEGKDKNVYWPFTHIELNVPWVFVGIYMALVLFSVVLWLTARSVPFLE